jgi:hypothetical protein
VEKKVKFERAGKHYIYATSVNDSFREKEGDVVRATTMIGYNSFERMEDGRIKFNGLMQSDFNVGEGMKGKVAGAAALN